MVFEKLTEEEILFLNDQYYGKFIDILRPINIPSKLRNEIDRVMSNPITIDDNDFPDIKSPIINKVLGIFLYNQSFINESIKIGQTEYFLYNNYETVTITFYDRRFKNGKNLLNKLITNNHENDNTLIYGYERVELDNDPIRLIGKPKEYKVTVPAKSNATNIDGGRWKYVTEWTHHKEYETTEKDNSQTIRTLVDGLYEFFERCKEKVKNNTKIIS